MEAATRKFVRDRAGDRCEYCQIPQSVTPFFRFHVEHVVAKQHGGGDELDNLALACNRCNAFKGPNLSAVDPQTKHVVPVFHPRQEDWDDHFQAKGGVIRGSTESGRATVSLLNMNTPDRVDLRKIAANRDS
jgi:5-methylcytosine-specific restriction endonuclease McrA